MGAPAKLASLALLPVVLAALVGACAPAPPATARQRRAVTGGVADDGDLGVVALGPSGSPECNGTLVAPRVVVTAAHCVAGALPEVFFGADPSAAGVRVASLYARTHPRYDPATRAYDAAVLLLAEAAPADATPWPLLTTPLDDGWIGQELRLVGFGATAPEDREPRRKRMGFTRLRSYDATSFAFGPEPSQTCAGDSGGPAFVTRGGIEYLAGITSGGDPACAVSATDVRVDVVAADFIAPFVAESAPGVGGPGARCYYDANCAGGLCRPAPDEPRVSYCTAPCARSSDCPAGMACDTALCRLPEPSPGAFGAPCALAFECASEVCVRPAGGGEARCTVRCFPDLPDACPPATRCQEDGDAVGRYGCFLPAAGGGCQVGGAPPRAALGALLLALAALTMAARARRREPWS